MLHVEIKRITDVALVLACVSSPFLGLSMVGVNINELTCRVFNKIS